MDDTNAYLMQLILFNLIMFILHILDSIFYKEKKKKTHLLKMMMKIKNGTLLLASAVATAFSHYAIR